MKKSIITSIIIGFMVLIGSGSVYAADATVGVDINSAYVWRGMTFNDGLVFQPSLDVAAGGFGLNVWGNLDASDYDDAVESGEFSEVDITVSYGFDLEPVGITVGYIEYLFPTTEVGGGEAAREFFVSFGMDIVEGLSAGLDIYYEFELMDEYYASLGLGYSTALSDAVSLDFGAALGYAGDEYSADGDGGLYDYSLSAGLGYAVSDSLSLAASINYVDAFDEDKLETDTNFYGGVGIYYGF